MGHFPTHSYRGGQDYTLANRCSQSETQVAFLLRYRIFPLRQTPVSAIPSTFLLSAFGILFRPIEYAQPK